MRLMGFGEAWSEPGWLSASRAPAGIFPQHRSLGAVLCARSPLTFPAWACTHTPSNPRATHQAGPLTMLLPSFLWQNRTGYQNMYKEFRDVTLNGAVDQLYTEMASLHRIRAPGIQIVKTATVQSNQCQRLKVTMMHVSPLPRLAPQSSAAPRIPWP
jgi:ribosomal protein L20A (L18A)